MADDFQEKTEEATPKKLADAKKKGQVSRSQEFSSAFMLIAGLAVLYGLSSHLIFSTQTLMFGVFNGLSTDYGSIESITFYFREGLIGAFYIAGPMIALMFVIGFTGAVLQVGFNFSVEPLKPKWKTLNIFNPENYKKFFNTQVMMRTALGVGKIVLVTVICYLMIVQLFVQIGQLIHAAPKQIFFFIAWNSFVIGITIAILLLILGVIDFSFQKWKFKNDLKMSKQEIKDERKQTEGDVQVKSKMRAMMQGFSRNRMKENVPQADVVVANPVHFAVALKYDPETMAAPICVAKGARRMALIIKDLAKDSGVPIVENPPLAQGLFKAVDIGAPVPAHLFHGVAEVLAYVYRLNEKMGKGLPAPEAPVAS